MISRFHSILLLTLIFTMLAVQIYRGITLHIVVYGVPDSIATNRLLEILSSKKVSYTFYPLNSTSNVERFLKAVNLLRISGIPEIPPETCLVCFLKEGVTWEELVLSFDTPMVAVFNDYFLVAIGIALVSEDDLSRLLAFKDGEGALPVYTWYGEYTVKDPGIKAELAELLLGDRVRRSEISLWIFTSIISLAAADSINPCTFLLFTAILLLAVGSIGRGRALTIGLSFILAVLLGYYLLGLGLSLIMPFIPYLKYIVGLAGLIAGSMNIARGSGKEFKPGVPKAIREFVYSFIGLAYISPLISFILGFIVSFTLLPCSGGPYFVGIALLLNVRELLYRYILLLLYNIVFISPLLLILILTISLSRYSERLNSLRMPGKAKLMQIVSGLILVLISIYLLAS